MLKSDELAAKLEARAPILRARILKMVNAAHAGHPGGSLSAIDLINAIMVGWGSFRPTQQQKDWFVLGKGHAVPLAYLLWDKTNFYMMQEIIWNYGAGVACKYKLSPRNEKIIWYVKNRECYTFNLDDIRDKDVKYPNQKKNGKLRCNTLGKNPSDVWQIAKVTSGTNRASPERAPHPAQFPMDLIERIIKGFSNIGDVILDPFMGSGTVAEVALRNGRKVIGFETKEEYCEYSSHRVNTYLNENSMDLNRYVSI